MLVALDDYQSISQHRAQKVADRVELGKVVGGVYEDVGEDGGLCQDQAGLLTQHDQDSIIRGVLGDLEEELTGGLFGSKSFEGSGEDDCLRKPLLVDVLPQCSCLLIAALQGRGSPWARGSFAMDETQMGG